MSNLSYEIANKEVRRNNRFKPVIDCLVLASDNNKRNIKIFPYIKDLMIFAAMVGKRFNTKEAVNTSDSTGILLSTFAGSSGTSKKALADQHSYIFMFGLTELRDMKYIKDEHISEVINVFELYANGGLSIIHNWLIDSSWNPMILLDKIVDELQLEQEQSPIEIIAPVF